MTDEEDTQPTRPLARRRPPSALGASPWDLWQQRAQAAGVGVALAELGRAVMREADQHAWSEALQAECGWADAGAAMLARALADPGAAQARWRHLLDDDGRADG